MKKILIVSLTVVIVVLMILGLSINKENYSSENSEILRIHIRANSNSSVDQQVKYEIKNQLVDYMIPMLKNIETKQDVEDVIIENKSQLEKFIDNILKQKGFTYTSNIKLSYEEFPTRVYDGVTFESGFYDALIVELGSAQGNNWWCVIYPPICFTEYSNKSGVKVVYKSKIMEIINKIFKRS